MLTMTLNLFSVHSIMCLFQIQMCIRSLTNAFYIMTMQYYLKIVRNFALIYFHFVPV